MAPISETAAKQRKHFDRLGAEYAAAYEDAWSRKYRHRFIDGPLLEGLDLKGKRVLEAMCGSGSTTELLLGMDADVTGLDISETMLGIFRRRWPQCRAVCSSVLEASLHDASFDAVVVEGGLHHLHPHVETGIMEIHRLLKPGGYLCFSEPHNAYFLDRLRVAWYKLDGMFEKNEASIDMAALKRRFSRQFTFEREVYAGNIGYFFVLNSMIFRIPFFLKKLYSPAVLAMESAFSSFTGPRTAASVLARWKKI